MGVTYLEHVLKISWPLRIVFVEKIYVERSLQNNIYKLPWTY